jgi:predicted nucleic acid-binding protein
MASATLDTGALIALERGEKRMRTLLLASLDDGRTVTVPAVVLAEWWRGRSRRRLRMLDALDIEPTTATISKSAGEAIAAVAGATMADAIVMASAALRGDAVFTSDVEDLQRLQRHFPSVRVLRC